MCESRRPRTAHPDGCANPNPDGRRARPRPHGRRWRRRAVRPHPAAPDAGRLRGPAAGAREPGHPARGGSAQGRAGRARPPLRPSRPWQHHAGQHRRDPQLGRDDVGQHVLLCGPPGLGKTTLANIIANELGVAIKTTSGPAIDHAGALASMLLNQQDRDVFFIDEIHRLNKLVEESLYPALEDFRFDFVSGKGAGATPLRLTLPRFTCVGATTRQGLLSGPMRDRFGAVYRLDFYTEAELQ